MFQVPVALNDQTRTAKFRHGGWANIRKRVFEALEATEQPIARRNAFATCGCNATVQESDSLPRQYRVSATYCHDRLCTPCANARSAEIARCLLSRTKGMPLLFITLTLCGKGEALRPLVDKLYRSFRALRRHPLWEDKIRGGAAFLEVKYSDKARRWHPHLHLIADGAYIDQGELSTIWRTITKDSFIVDVRRVRDDEIVQGYVTKYASKPLNSSFSNDPSLLQEALLSLKGRRLCFCFGDWYRIPLHDVDAADDDPTGWSPLATLEQVLHDAEIGSDFARRLISLCNADARWRAYCLNTS